MYGMPGNRFGQVVRACSPKDLEQLVKEAQIRGKRERTFFSSKKELHVAYDGMFLINNRTGELLDENALQGETLFTQVM